MKRLWTGIFSSVGLLVLILDAKTGIQGAAEGLALCIKSIIPSLLPFFVLSILITNSLAGKRIRVLQPLERLLRIPKGSGSIFLIGILGGYPVGAQSVAQGHKNGSIRKIDAQRMLGFCSNAGPSFLFGIIACKFSGMEYAWALWLIHILSAVLVGILLPGGNNAQTKCNPSKDISMTDALQKAIGILAGVCGWVILFRVVIAFLTRWILWVFPDWVQVFICGILELANGCCALDRITNEGLRFIVCSGMLAFGGLCVCMQTASVTGELGFGQYFPGKVMQCGISVVLSFLCQRIVGRGVESGEILLLFGIIPTVLPLFLCKIQKNSSIPALHGV